MTLDFLKSGAAKALTLILVGQAVALYSFSKPEVVPSTRALAEFPEKFGSWVKLRDGVVEPEVRDALQADDLLTREYQNSRVPVGFFVAAFRSQRNGKAPHSPKNCLPGNGFVQQEEGRIQIPVDGQAAPLDVNRYVVVKGDYKTLVLYWYQSRDRAVADEYHAKFYVIADALRYNRTDTALVRVVVPLLKGMEAEADAAGLDFIRSMYPNLRNFLPQ